MLQQLKDVMDKENKEREKEKNRETRQELRPHVASAEQHGMGDRPDPWNCP